MTINLDDEKHPKLLEEIQSLFNGENDDNIEVFFFDHIGGEQGHEIYTRTAVIDWNPDEWLILQTHNWVGESEVHTVRIPAAAVKFMVSEMLAKSIYSEGYSISPNGQKFRMRHSRWKATE